MKLLLIIILFQIAVVPIKSQEWKQIKKIQQPTRSNYDKLKCADSLNCIALGIYEYGNDLKYFFERTTDGGITWEIVYEDSTIKHIPNTIGSDIREIAYPDSNLILAVGTYGIIIKSTDYGKTWRKEVLDTNFTYYRLRMLDNKFGIMCGSMVYELKSHLYYTNNGGISWTEINFINEFNNVFIEDLQILNKNEFIFLGFDNVTKQTNIVLVKNNWEEYYSYPRNQYTHHMYFTYEKKGWLSGGTKISDFNLTQLIQHTSDGGKTWITQRDVFVNSFSVKDMDFYDDNNGMATAGDGLILKTNNGGKIWKMDTLIVVPNGYSFPIKSVQFPSITTAYCIGDSRYIYKYTRDWSVSAEESQNDGYSLQVYPNPASDNVSLAFSKGLADFANIEITDLRGITIKQFSTNEFLYKMDVSDISPGLYLIKAKVKDKIIAKKLNILR